jgi:hypothetical protein
MKMLNGPSHIFILSIPKIIERYFVFAFSKTHPGLLSGGSEQLFWLCPDPALLELQEYPNDPDGSRGEASCDYGHIENG